MIDRRRIETVAYAALRMIAGFLFLWHGSQKLLGFPGGHDAPAVFSQMWFGGIVELIGGALVMLGLVTRWAAFVASGQMAVAYIQFHWKGALGSAFLPIVNHGEPAVLYCFVFLYIWAHGPGRLSLDQQLGRA